MGDKDIIPMLNKKLVENPKTQLPNGYKRIADKSVSVIYTVPPAIGVQISGICIEVLDEILYSALGIHFLEPYIEISTKYQARGVLVKPEGNSALLERPKSLTRNAQSYNAQSLLNDVRLGARLRFEVSQAPPENQPNLLQVALVLEDLVHTVEVGSKRLLNRQQYKAAPIPNAAKQLKQIKAKALEI